MAYKIGNPRGIDKEIRIMNWPCHYPDPKTGELAIERNKDGNAKLDEEGNTILKLRKGMTEDLLWYEGDDFVRPEGMTDKAFESRLAEGFIVEVSDGD